MFNLDRAYGPRSYSNEANLAKDKDASKVNLNHSLTSLLQTFNPGLTDHAISKLFLQLVFSDSKELLVQALPFPPGVQKTRTSRRSYSSTHSYVWRNSASEGEAGEGEQRRIEV